MCIHIAQQQYSVLDLTLRASGFLAIHRTKNRILMAINLHVCIGELDNEMIGGGTKVKNPCAYITQSQDGELLYEWSRFADPFVFCAGLDGDHCGDVGLYAGEAGEYAGATR